MNRNKFYFINIGKIVSITMWYFIKQQIWYYLKGVLWHTKILIQHTESTIPKIKNNILDLFKIRNACSTLLRK
jgi:hypothetical protein